MTSLRAVLVAALGATILLSSACSPGATPSRVPAPPTTAATVHIRYQTPDRKQSIEQARELTTESIRTDPNTLSPRYVQAATVAGFADVLRHSYWARDISLQDVARAANTRLGSSSDAAVRELVQLTERAASLAPKTAP